jgi:hypothetical protein
VERFSTSATNPDADSGNLVISRRAAGEHGGLGGLHGSDEDTRLPLRENLTHACDRSARADGGNKTIDRSMAVVFLWISGFAGWIGICEAYGTKHATVPRHV